MHEHLVQTSLMAGAVLYGFLFVLVIVMGFVILLWHSLGHPYYYLENDSVDRNAPSVIQKCCLNTFYIQIQVEKSCLLFS